MLKRLLGSLSKQILKSPAFLFFLSEWVDLVLMFLDFHLDGDFVGLFLIDLGPHPAFLFFFLICHSQVLSRRGSLAMIFTGILQEPEV